MKPSPLMTLGVAIMLLLARPRCAHADEAETETPVPRFVEAPMVVAPLGARLSPSASFALPARASFFSPAPADIRLSHGAKTAIIVTAIVVGVLVIVGVVAVARPFRP